MSADNWRVCPKCEASRNKMKLKEQEKLDASYGKISISEYKKKQEKLDKLENENLPMEFREDYGIYSEGTTVYVEYSGNCQVCGFTYYNKIEWEMCETSS